MLGLNSDELTEVANEMYEMPDSVREAIIVIGDHLIYLKTDSQGVLRCEGLTTEEVRRLSLPPPPPPPIQDAIVVDLD